MKKLFTILFLFVSALSFGQSLTTQYTQGKQRVADSIGYYPTYSGHTIDKITTAGCWWNLWDFTRNVYDTVKANYYTQSQVAALVNARVLKADSNSFTVGGYATPAYVLAHAGATDTASLSARIDEKKNISDSVLATGYTTRRQTAIDITDSLGNITGGTGISVNPTTHVITNTAPDQTVSITSGTGISATGTYPNFTITNTSPSSGGTVTSVSVTTANGMSGTVANAATTPAISLSLDTIQSNTEMAGTIHSIAIADPATPQPNTGYIYMDATHHVLNIKNDAGVVSNTAIPNAGGSGLYLASFAADGTFATGTLPTGTVTAVSIATANGFAGSSSGGATPALTMSVTPTSGSILKSTTGGAITAAVAGTDYLTANQTTTVTTTGDATGTASGTTNISVPLTLATVNSNVGSFTYGSFTVNAKGLITAASSGTAPTTYTAGRGLGLSSTTFYADTTVLQKVVADTTISAAYTLTSRDANRSIHCTNSSNIALTIPTGLATTFRCEVIQEAAGTVTPTASSTTLTFIPTGTTKTKQAGSAMIIRSWATANSFTIQGDLQ